MRIAVLIKERCTRGKGCDYICTKVCPINKSGGECIKIGDDGYPIIDENLCTGCGICIKKCPFNAIAIVNLPEELKEGLIHQYGENGFRVYRMVSIRDGIVGLMGRNGLGKTTLLNILSGNLIPNFGGEPSKEKVLENFRGTELFDYFKDLYENKIKVSYKPQNITLIPKFFKGKVKDFVKEEFIELLNLEKIKDRELEKLSGGELQKVAIAGSLQKGADLYFFDEPSSYLDIRERLRISQIIRDKVKKGIVVEHDLVILDYLTDYIQILYGEPKVYGIVSEIMGNRVGINSYLDGYLKGENIKFRERIVFDKGIKEEIERKIVFEWPLLQKKFEGFELEVKEGFAYEGEIIGIVGPNGIGKTTFIKMLAGVEKPDNTELEGITVSYKPQYLKAERVMVRDVLREINPNFDSKYNMQHIIKPLGVHFLFNRYLDELSGGELQAVAIASCLIRDADIYLLDEPSAFLDIELRLNLSKILNKFSKDNKKVIFVVDHDLLFIDFISERVMPFLGDPGVKGIGYSPLPIKDGLNKFLEFVNVTVRKDPDTKRPRINKKDSVKDREQRKMKKYYLG